MKNKILFILSLPFLLTACPSKTKVNYLDVVKYLDQEAYVTDEISIGPRSLTCGATSSGNYQIMLYLTIKNPTASKQLYKFSNYSFVRESTEYGYDTSLMNITYTDRQELEPDMSMSPCYLSSLPTDIKTEKYYLISTINNIRYKLYLYNSDGSFYNGFGYF